MAKQSSDRSTVDAFPRFRTAYGPKLKVVTDVSGESRTKQSFKDECDINVIMRRYEKTGVIPFLDNREPRYMDCSGYDFQQAQLLVSGARSMFQELPAKLRDRFDNDPARLLEFLGDDRNLAEAVELGLVDPRKRPEPVEVRFAEGEAAKAAGSVVTLPEGKENPPKGGK